MAAPREGCLWMCCVSTAHFYSILSRFHQLVSKKMHWAKPSSVLILIFLKTLIEHSDNEYKKGLGVHRDKKQVKQTGIAAELLSPEMQESPVFPDAVFKNEERIKKIPMTPTNIKHQKTKSEQKPSMRGDPLRWLSVKRAIVNLIRRLSTGISPLPGQEQPPGYQVAG